MSPLTLVDDRPPVIHLETVCKVEYCYDVTVGPIWNCFLCNIHICAVLGSDLDLTVRYVKN